jgi:hypothetical protein
MLAELLTARVGCGISKDRFGFPSLLPKRYFLCLFTELYRRVSGEGCGYLRMLNSDRTWANAGRLQGKLQNDLDRTAQSPRLPSEAAAQYFVFSH